MAKTICYKFTRGDTQLLKKFRLTDKNGNILNLTELDQLYFTLKKDAYSEGFIFQKKKNGGIILKEDGYYHITIESDDTNDLDYGNYDYDIELKSTLYGVKTLIKGTITLTEEITWKGDE